MKVAILDQKVRRNIAFFKHLIKMQAEKKTRFFQASKKAYKGYLNCKTGDLRFSELVTEKFNSKEWKPITIQLHPIEGEGAFEVVASEDDQCFDCASLEPIAYAVLTKTLHILNQLTYDPKQGKNPFWILRQVAQLDFEITEEEEGRKNLVHEAWHNIDRLRAETLLKRMPVGTYLFRKGEFTELLEENLNRASLKPISCFVLTYKEENQKISEKILVYMDGSWLFYNDDTSLSCPSFPTVEALLQTLGDTLSKPLLSD